MRLGPLVLWVVLDALQIRGGVQRVELETAVHAEIVLLR